MAVLFTDVNSTLNRGRVTVLYQQNGGAGGMIQATGWGGFESMLAIFTRLDIGESTHQQFQHTMGNRIYGYMFGDQMGSLNLGGLAFADACQGGVTTPGLVRVLRYYRQHRLTRFRAPIKITIQPDLTLEAYLVGAQVGIADAEQNLYQFNYQLALIPEDSSFAEKKKDDQP